MIFLHKGHMISGYRQKDRIIPLPFFLDELDWNSLSSTLTEILLYFMRQKNERRVPEHSRAAPTGRSAWTCRPAKSMTEELNLLPHTSFSNTVLYAQKSFTFCIY